MTVQFSDVGRWHRDEQAVPNLLSKVANPLLDAAWPREEFQIPDSLTFTVRIPVAPSVTMRLSASCALWSEAKQEFLRS